MNPQELDAIEQDIIADLLNCAATQRDDVARGEKTPKLAALLVVKYAEGLSTALRIESFVSNVMKEADKLAREIDPDYGHHGMGSN